MNVRTHPLAERLKRKLFGIRSVDEKEMNRMINRAIKSSIEFFDRTITEVINSCDITIKKQHDALESALVLLVEGREFMNTHDLLESLEKEILKGLKWKNQDA